MARINSRLRNAIAAVQGFSAILALGLIVAAGSGAARAATVSNAGCQNDPMPHCVITDPVYVNVYWALNPAAWNKSVVAASTPDMTQENIDLTTKAVLASSYFGPLSQYFVNPPRWGGSYNCPGPAPSPPGTPKPTYDTLISQGTPFDNLIACLTQQMSGVVGGLSPSIIVNVFLPPFVDASSLCATKNGTKNGPHETAKHVQISSPNGSPPVPVIATMNSTDPTCNASLRALIASLSHEMVEAATDPYVGSDTSKWGFTTYRPTSVTDMSTSIASQEIGDLCEGFSTGFNDGPGTPFLDATVARYWIESNDPAFDGACTIGVTSVQPIINAASLQGSGSGTAIVLDGVFGDDPGADAGIASRIAGIDARMYVRVQVSDAAGNFRWGAGLPGNSIPGRAVNAVALKNIFWAKDLIRVEFGDGYSGSNVFNPGDQFQVTVFSPVSGQSASSAAVTLPVPSSIALEKPFQVTPNVQSTLTWRVKGPNSNNFPVPVANAPVNLKTAALAGGAVRQLFTDDNGEVSLTLTLVPPKVAGNVTATATAGALSQTDTIYSLYPTISGLSRGFGTFKGGQPIAVTGTAFDAANVPNNSVAILPGIPTLPVSFDAKGAMTFSTPPSPLPGNSEGSVSVVANVNGLASNPAQYVYILPGKPYLVLQGADPCNKLQLPGRTEAFADMLIELAVFKEDGAIDPVLIQLDGIEVHEEWVRDPAGGRFSGHLGFAPIKVTSGQLTKVNFKGATQFTARNLATGTTATIQLTCISNAAELAAATKAAEAAANRNGEVQRIKLESEQVQPQYDKPMPDPQSNSAQWLQKAILSGFEQVIGGVTIAGGKAEDIARSYAVRTIPTAELSRAIQINGRVIAPAGEDVNAKFVGNAVEIKPVEQVRSLSASGDKAIIRFQLPAPSGGLYQLAHFEKTRGGAAWVIKGAASYVAGRHQFAAAATDPGHYAVVLVMTPAANTRLIKGQ